MGLDNMPVEYPCEADHGVIFADSPEGSHCSNMQACGKCPWYDALGNEPGAVYGMFGLNCWYRGKMGNYLIEVVNNSGEDLTTGIHGHLVDFYGNGINNQTEGISPGDCSELATWLSERREQFMVGIAKEEPDADPEDAANVYMYAIKWLRFVSNYGGSAIWY